MTTLLTLTESLYPQGGGAELATYLLLKHLVAEGFRVQIVVSKYFHRTKKLLEGMNVICRPSQISENDINKWSNMVNANLLLHRSIGKIIRLSDVIYVPRWYSGILLGKALHKPVIVHLHDYLPACPLATLYNLSEKAPCKESCVRNLAMNSMPCILAHKRHHERGIVKPLISGALNLSFGRLRSLITSLGDALVFVSNYQMNRTLELLPNLREKSYVIPNMIPRLPHLKIGEDFGYFGGYDVLKGFRVLHTALKELSSFGYTFRIHLAKMQNSENPIRKRLRKFQILEYGHLSKVEYEEVQKLLRTVIIPSIIEEPSPYVAIESLLYGRILIAPKCGGISEIAGSSPGVFYFQPGDYRELAKAMLHTASLSYDEAFEMGLNNRQAVLQRIDNRQVGRQFIRIIENLL